MMPLQPKLNTPPEQQGASAKARLADIFVSAAWVKNCQVMPCLWGVSLRLVMGWCPLSARTDSIRWMPPPDRAGQFSSCNFPQRHLHSSLGSIVVLRPGFRGLPPCCAGMPKNGGRDEGSLPGAGMPVARQCVRLKVVGAKCGRFLDFCTEIVWFFLANDGVDATAIAS